MTPFYARKHDGFLQAHYETGKNRLINNTRIMAPKMKNGYSKPCYFHLKVNPLIEEGLSYITLFRNYNLSEFSSVMILEDGEIDAMMETFG